MSPAPQPSPQPIPRYTPLPQSQTSHVPRINFSRELASGDFLNWIDASPQREQHVAEYHAFLQQGAGEVPPMEQMLRSARSWEVCGFEPYEIPPRKHWGDMVATLKLLNHLKQQRYLPNNLKIVSVYRNPVLNRCAKGSKGSKHLMNAAVDLRIDYPDEYVRFSTEQNLCQFWNEQGELYQFGLGIYKSGTIHIDTQGYRRWGSSYGGRSSPCMD